MKKSPLIIVDADAIVAQAFPDDSNHKTALHISQVLVEWHAAVLYPVTAVTEGITVLQRVLGSAGIAHDTAIAFTQPEANLVDITHDVYTYAVQAYFQPKGSKKHTIFDCIVAAIAKKHHADAIFSFDGFYKKNGFRLTSDLVSENGSLGK